MACWSMCRNESFERGKTYSYCYTKSANFQTSGDLQKNSQNKISATFVLLWMDHKDLERPTVRWWRRLARMRQQLPGTVATFLRRRVVRRKGHPELADEKPYVGAGSPHAAATFSLAHVGGLINSHAGYTACAPRDKEHHCPFKKTHSFWAGTATS